MATIRIADDAHSPKLQQVPSQDDDLRNRAGRSIYMRDLNRSATNQSDDGIVNIRDVTRDHSRDRRRSFSSLSNAEDEDPGLRQPGDFVHAQHPVGSQLAWLTFQAVGVIYGDIGTSPLYVYSSTFTGPPDHDDLVGVLSLVLWSLVMMVTVKYVIIILMADNNGEGGTFSTYSLLARYLNITNRDPREASMVEMKRYQTGDLDVTGRGMRRGIEKSKFIRKLLQVMGIFAVTMVLSDGVLTPAQSVLGAVQGIEVVQPNISRGLIIGVTDAILVLLFLIQPFGISKITILFAPVIMIWLTLNAAFGIYNLVKYDAGVFAAFNPGYAFQYLIRHKEEGWRSLGGVLLSFTGVEALFADLGAFSRRAVRISWLGFVLPCLILTYVGQAAYISVHPEAWSNPVFNAAPPGTIYPTLIIAILAAIVASQAIITASFQLLSQVMKLSYFPQLKVVHTSKTFHGQLYVPVANWLLMIGTIIIASVYKNTTALGNAYGVCVMFVTFFDTTMVSLAAIFVWKIPPYYVALPWLIVASMDGAFLSSALTKVPQGTWFTITLSIVIASVFMMWRFGKEQQWFAEADDRFPTSHLVTKGPEGKMKLTDKYSGAELSTMKGFGIFFDKAGETTPTVFSQFLLKLEAMPAVMVFFHLRPLETPSIEPESRFTVSRLGIPHCYRCVVRYGYNDEVITPDLGHVVFEQVRKFITERESEAERLVTSVEARDTTDAASQMRRRSVTTVGTDADGANDEYGSPVRATSSTSAFSKRPDSTHEREAPTTDDKAPQVTTKSANDLITLETAYQQKVLYIVGKEQMKIKVGTSAFRRLILSIFLWVRDNSRGKIANLKVPTESLIEVGFLKEI